MEGHLQLGGHRTWYRVVGEFDASARRGPVIVCHGGPGATHDYVAPIAEQLASTARGGLRPLDQLGNGRSDHLPDADPSFWTVDLFERELTALADHLGIAGRYHVVGQSWGGMLALLQALERPAGS
jgi:L-proline amide hydrolase